MKDVIFDKIESAVKALQKQHVWPDMPLPIGEVSYSQHKQHGDYASNIGMKLAKVLKKSPMAICEELKEHIDMEGLDRIEAVQPGFLNFYINEEFLRGGVQYILKAADDYGKNRSGIGEDGEAKKYLVEFISANPTGPLHLGNGRGGFSGDAIVKVLRASSYDVTAEYWINDAGSQVDTLAESVLRRYLQKEGIKVDFSEELYQGDYIKDLAEELKLDDVPLAGDAMTKVRDEVKVWALEKMLKQIKELVEQKLGIKFDVWKRESTMFQTGRPDRALEWMQEHDLIYEKDGAQFFASSKYGDEKDRVIIRSTGDPTYFYTDILYLFEKFEERNIEHWILILGADHHGYKGRMEAALEGLGHKGKMEIIFVQLVRLIFNGKELKMSKRKGTFVTLEELVEEVGLDVVRWFFLAHEPNTHMDFDLNLAREQSDKNPVFYVQYAHARIASVLEKVGKVKKIPLDFTSAGEEDLAKVLFRFPELVEEISVNQQVHKLTQYATEVARSFHKFYAHNRIIDEDDINYTRVQLVQATQIVLRNCLALMGITAPDKM